MTPQKVEILSSRSLSIASKDIMAARNPRAIITPFKIIALAGLLERDATSFSSVLALSAFIISSGKRDESFISCQRSRLIKNPIAVVIRSRKVL